MKKIITILALVALTTVSAKAIDVSNFSLTAGYAANQSVFGASARQDGYNAAGTSIDITDKQTGVFEDSYGSYLVELGIGKYLSIGYEHTPDSISTPTNVNDGAAPGGAAGDTTSTLTVDFNDLNTTYAKLNLPFMDGAYVKTGVVETSIDIKETQLSGNTYANKDVSGTMVGGGYQKQLGETGFDLRFEAAYTQLDNVTTNNGVVKTAGTGINNHKEVKATNLQGLTGKIAITYTFGRN